MSLLPTSRSPLSAPALLLGTLSFLACSQPTPIQRTDDHTPLGGAAGVAGSGGAAVTPVGGSGGSAGAAPVVDCAKERPGAKMVRIERKEHGDAYCIDATETTQAEYAVFLKEAGKAPSAYDTDPYCKENNPNGYALHLGKWSDDKRPPCGSPSLWDPVKYAQQPVRCVDWCDASAYCAWAGKRLCGLRDGAKVQYDPESVTSPVQSSEWGYACAEGQPDVAAELPRPEACFRPANLPGARPQPIDERTTCVGSKPPYDQICDLQGNVREWTNERMSDPNGGPIPLALERGVLPVDGAPQKSRGVCLDGGPSALADAANDVGFRCCAD